MSAQTREANKKIAGRLAEEVFSKGKMKVFDEIFADNYVMHNMPVANIPGTKEGFRKLVLATGHAFPDVRVHVDEWSRRVTVRYFTTTLRQRAKAIFWVSPRTASASRGPRSTFSGSLTTRSWSIGQL
jgi:hypothetical protein